MSNVFTLDINVFTVVFLLLMFLGLQMQIRRIANKIDDLKDNKPK